MGSTMLNKLHEICAYFVPSETQKQHRDLTKFTVDLPVKIGPEDVKVVRTHYEGALAMLHKHEEGFFNPQQNVLLAQAIRSVLEEPYERFGKTFPNRSYGLGRHSPKNFN